MTTQAERAPVPRPETILVIEDDPDVAALIQQLLVEDDYRVLAAGSVEEGRQYYDPRQIDLVMLDAMLPGASGWDFCRELKEPPPQPFVPVLMLTARAELHDRVRGLDAGADDYLTKPFDIDELLAHVRAMLRIRRAEVQLWQRANELEVLNAVATAVNSSLDLKQTLSLAIEQMVRVAQATVGVVRIHQAGVNTPLLAAAGLDETQREQFAREWQAEPSLGGQVLKNVVSGLTSLIQLPLLTKGTTLGELILGSDQPAAFDSAMIKLLETLTATIAVAVENAWLYTQTRQIADTDPLTGLYNRRFMLETIETETGRAQRSRRPFAVVMMDLDNFKAYNDTYYHQGGDQLLCETASMLTTVCRKTDYVGRYGGDEFILVLPETNAEQAQQLADRIQTAFVALPARRHAVQVVVGLSIGVAIYPFDSAVGQTLVRVADATLYRAKREGKQRTLIASGSLSLTPPSQPGPFAHLESLVITVDSRIGFGRLHAEATARWAERLARHLRLSQPQIQAVFMAGLLHDIGNIGIPPELLTRPGPLGPDEQQIMRQHVLLSGMLLDRLSTDDEMLQAVIHHHERWDGGGYPRGLSGEAIPLLGRLLMIASAYAAMREPRPYRLALAEAAALEEMQRGAGTQFDPTLVQAFVPIVSERPRLSGGRRRGARR